jgi:peptide/nickel transport system substrate-binding protein
MIASRGRAAGLAAWLLLFPVLSGAGESQTQRHNWTRPGVLRIGVVGEPHSLNPLFESTGEEDEINALTNSLLLGTDERGQPCPELAARVPSVQNGDISRDGKTVVFRLRHGVKWHDGTPFTSADVKFSWQAVMNPANNVLSRTGYDIVTAVDTPDPYTAVVRLNRPFGPLLAEFFSGGQTARIIPAHLLAGYPNLNKVPYDEKPIGTGPYKVLEWRRGQSIELEANDDYFLGRPAIRHISVRIIPSFTTIGVQLKTHELDFVNMNSATYGFVRNDPDVKVILANSYYFASLQYNVSRPLVKDVRVRAAIAHAIDRPGLVRHLTFGIAPIATGGDIAPASWAHTTDVTQYPYDPKQAMALLDRAGWKPGPDGIRVKNGVKLSLQMVDLVGDTTGRNGDVEIQEMLHNVGIDVQIHEYSAPVLYGSKAEGGIYANGKFDVAFQAWAAGADPDNSTLFLCKNIPPGGQNFSFYCDRRLDALEEQAMSSYDQSARKVIYAQIEKKIVDDLPFYFLYYPKQRIGMNPDLAGFKSNGVTPTYNAYEWSI